MQNEQQFEQLMLQYNQLKNGASDIRQMIENENFDDAMTLIKSREEVFLNCKCMRNYLELNPTQQRELDTILDEIRTLEIENIRLLEKNMMEVHRELKKTAQNEKIQQAYDFDENQKGSIINFTEE